MLAAETDWSHLTVVIWPWSSGQGHLTTTLTAACDNTTAATQNMVAVGNTVWLQLPLPCSYPFPFFPTLPHPPTSPHQWTMWSRSPAAAYWRPTTSGVSGLMTSPAVITVCMWTSPTGTTASSKRLTPSSEREVGHLPNPLAHPTPLSWLLPRSGK